MSIRYTFHSEYLPLMSVCLKTAADAFVSQKFIDKQWRELNYLSPPDFTESLDEYALFKEFIGSMSGEVLEIPASENAGMDSIYCRDASIATDFGMIICRMGKKDRNTEPGIQEEFFKAEGIPMLGSIQAPGTLEGGDVAWLDTNTLAVGHTYRTNSDGIRQLKDLLEPRGVQVIVAELPHYRGRDDVFHLMSILSPVDKDLVVVYSPLMPIRFRNQLLDRGFELVEVPEDEFESMGCNVLATGPRHCLVVEGNPVVKQRLIEAGCTVDSYRGNHISIKGGGGPTCLTRPLRRALE